MLEDFGGRGLHSPNGGASLDCDAAAFVFTHLFLGSKPEAKNQICFTVIDNIKLTNWGLGMWWRACEGATNLVETYWSGALHSARPCRWCELGGGGTPAPLVDQPTLMGLLLLADLNVPADTRQQLEQVKWGYIKINSRPIGHSTVAPVKLLSTKMRCPKIRGPKFGDLHTQVQWDHQTEDLRVQKAFNEIAQNSQLVLGAPTFFRTTTQT